MPEIYKALLSKVLPYRTPFTLIAIIGTGITALMVGFLPSLFVVDQWFHATGYYLIFASVFVWIHSLLPVNWDPIVWRQRLTRHGLAIGIAAVLLGGALLTSAPTFRVLSDETNLMGVAMAMYDDGFVWNPIEGRYHYEKFVVQQYVGEKRPLLFPFLVSVLHTIIGYSAYNGMVLNAAVGFLSWVVFYWVLQRRFGRFFGIIGMVLLAAYPIYILWVTSSGFEILNVLFILVAFLLLDDFLVHRTARHAERLALGLVLLAQVRYESAVFAIIIFPLLPFLLPRAQYASLSLRTVILPCLLLPVLWQRRLDFENQPIDEGLSVFSTQWVWPNLQNAWKFFTAQDSAYGTIEGLFFVAIVGAAVAAIRWMKFRHIETKRTRWMRRILLLSFAAEAAILAAFYWGDLTTLYNIRLGLVFLPLVVLLVVYLLHCVPQSNATKRFIALGTVGILLYAWPQAGANDAVRRLSLYVEYHAVLGFVEKHYPESKLLIVTDRPGLYTPHRWGAVGIEYANKHQWRMHFEWSQHFYDEMLVIQRIPFTSDSFPQSSNSLQTSGSPTPETQLAEVFRLQTLYEFQVAETHFLRISRIKSVVR